MSTESQFRAGRPPLHGAVLPPPRTAPLAAVYDNPILWKHIRSRLRLQNLLPSIVVVVVLSSLILWGAQLQGGIRNGGAFTALLFMQGAILLLMGTSQVAASVAHAKESGVLDFHRVSPLPASWVALGFLLGAPIREYVMFACTLPFSLLCAAAGVPTFAGFFGTMAMLVLSSIMFHALGMVAGLVSRRPRGSGGAIIGLVILAHIMAANATVGFGITPPAFLTVIPTAQMAIRQAPESLVGPGQRPFIRPLSVPSFYGLPLPAAMQSFIFQTALLTFLFLAAVRKMRRERAPLYSKGLAVAFLAVLALLTIGGLWDFSHSVDGTPGEHIVPVVVVLYTLFIAAVLLCVSTTPSASDIANGCRRANKLGLSRLNPWHDLSPNRWAITAFCGVVLLSSLATGVQTDVLGALGFWMCTAVAVLSVAQFGLARQYFELAFGRRAQPFFLLFLFLAWLVPMLVGAILGMARAEMMASMVLSISPLIGIGAAAAPPRAFMGDTSLAGFGAAQMTALLSSAALTILFAVLSAPQERAILVRTNRTAAVDDLE